MIAVNAGAMSSRYASGTPTWRRTKSRLASPREERDNSRFAWRTHTTYGRHCRTSSAPGTLGASDCRSGRPPERRQWTQPSLENWRLSGSARTGWASGFVNGSSLQVFVVTASSQNVRPRAHTSEARSHSPVASVSGDDLRGAAGGRQDGVTDSFSFACSGLTSV